MENFSLADKLLQDYSTSKEEEKTSNQPRIKVISAIDFISLNIPARENVLSPWLPQQGITMIYAPRGIGKTFTSLGIGYAVASGGSIFSWTAPKPRGVLFIDGEMPASVLQERLAKISISSTFEPTAPLKIITPDLQSAGMIDLSSRSDQLELLPYLEDIDLIIVDNLSTLCRTGKENEGEAWLPIQAWALQQRAAGRSVLFIHHAGKNGEQRGTSRREDVLDTVIALKRPGDYTPDKGACFEVYFEKARGIYGDDTKPFEAQLNTLPDGRLEWITKPLEQSTVEKVAALLNDGIPQGEISDILKVSKGTVSKAKSKAAAQGLISHK
jgi:putative DNA primase/helicase